MFEAALYNVLVILNICVYYLVVATKNPNIIFILADDLGWNDVGFHGSGQIPTPNIDALAYNGIILNKYYVTPICTPSRSALMTGKYPIHTGMQHKVLYGAEPRGLPLKEKLLPEYLQELGYRTHIVGKWHLGFFKKEYTPTFRGFESHLGYWTGHHDYYDHTAFESPYWGLDMRRNLEPAWNLHGKYSTDVFTKESVRIINNHNNSQPLFLYLAHAAVHSANPYNPLPVDDNIVEKIQIPEYKRRRFAAMMNVMDTSVGAVVEALDKKNMLQDSIIIFSTDNGGPAQGFNLNAASNWPLRGVKDTLFEGGVRGVGLIWSPRLSKTGRVANQMIHITDWLPTLIYAAGGNLTNSDIDGINVWDALSEDKESPRNFILHNIDDIFGVASITRGNWKLIKGSTYKGRWNGWYGPSGREYNYNISDLIENSPVSKILKRNGFSINVSQVEEIRQAATINCSNKQDEENFSPCDPTKAPCLINISQDPCERENLAAQYPDVLKILEEELEKINSTAIPPANLPYDNNGNPEFWNHTWNNFGDYEIKV